MPEEKQDARLAWWLAAVPLAVALVGLGLLVGWALDRRARQQPAAVPRDPSPPPLSEPVVPSEPDVPVGSMLAIVIDDLGNDLAALDRLLALNAELTFAVMPGRRHTLEVARRVAGAGRELILHQPMEPKGFESGYAGGPGKGPDPGEGAVLLTMSPESVGLRVASNLDAVPGLAGLNNHMGSAFTENEPLMRAALMPAVERNLYFLDSRTTPASVGYRLARELGLRAVQRDVFLDHKIDREAIRQRFAEAARIARREGAALAVGHPHPETIDVLSAEIPLLEGVSLVRASLLAGAASPRTAKTGRAATDLAGTRRVAPQDPAVPASSFTQ